MSCPDIYIAPTYWTTPHTAWYANTEIDVGTGGTTFVRGVNRIIQVTVRNHGTENSPDSHLELFWADPSSSFALMASIGAFNNFVPGGDGIATDGWWSENFSWTPPTSAVSTNGGHVCLLAQVANNSSPVPLPDGTVCATQGHLASSSAAIDARSAIRNIHVVAPAKSKFGKKLPGGKENGMNFAFAAADADAHRGETRLKVRALDPKKDREQLELLAADPSVHHALSRRRGKFALPEAVMFAQGVERVVLPQPRVIIQRPGQLRSMPRIGHLGPLRNEVAARLLPHGTKVIEAKKPMSLELVPGEMRQIIVHVIPGKTDGFYAVRVDHEGPDEYAIGGLVMIFVPPADLF